MGALASSRSVAQMKSFVKAIVPEMRPEVMNCSFLAVTMNCMRPYSLKSVKYLATARAMTHTSETA